MSLKRMCDTCGHEMVPIQWHEHRGGKPLIMSASVRILGEAPVQEEDSMVWGEELDLCWPCFDKLRKTTVILAEPPRPGTIEPAIVEEYWSPAIVEE